MEPFLGHKENATQSGDALQYCLSFKVFESYNPSPTDALQLTPS
ncbi:hypothetical protein [Spirosoma rhododendri]|nr:hypothetical protein [Spirosoma rhododendri]